MENILLYISNGLILFSYFCYLLLVFINKRNNISNSSGFDITKDMISEYNSINIIEGSSKFSFYNIKRRVIKLSKDDYYGNNVSSISLSIIQGGISVNDDRKNKFINNCRKFIPTLKIFDLLGIFTLIINYISSTMSDARIGIVFVGLVMILHYMYADILNNSYNFVSDNIKKIKDIKKDGSNKILEFINKVILFNKIQFIAEIIVIVRMVSILLNM